MENTEENVVIPSENTMAEIISDGVRSVTSDDTSSRDYSGLGRGYGYGENLPYHMAQWQGEQVRDLLSADAKTEIAVEKTGAATSLAIEKIGSAGILENQKNAFALALQANLIDSRRDNATGFAANALAHATNTAAIQAAIAHCCCELKEAIHMDGNMTRALINSKDALDKAVELVDAKNQISEAGQTGVLKQILDALVKK